MIRKMTIPGIHLAGLMPAVLISVLVHVGASAAAEPAPAAQYPIQQPAQSVADSLRAIAHETSTSVLFDPAIVRGRTAHAVSGNLTAFEAITAALEGTGLAAERTGDGSFLVKPAAMPNAAPASGVRASAPSVGAALAEGDIVATVDSKQDDGATVTRVEITGTRLKRINAEGPAPVNVYTAKDIEQSGQPTLERFLAGLNEVSAASGEGGFGSTSGQATVQLRGLPVGSTLVLINGRRIQAMGSTADNYFNLNMIPTAAIERVEIVPVGSSAVYGGDALAGVVNVILKKSIDGVSVSANLGSGRAFGGGGLSIATGGHSADGSYLVLGSYTRATPLGMAERGFFRNADYRRFGGPDARGPNCTPGTVSSVSGANLPGLNSSFAAIPTLSTGQSPQLSDYTSTSGTTNLCNRFADGKGEPLTYGEDAVALHATGDYKILGSWSVFGELTLVRDRLEARDLGLDLTDVTVPTSNAYNPFGQDVKVTTALGTANGLSGFARQARFTRALGGVRGTLTTDWDAEVTVSTARDTANSQTFAANVNDDALANALASSSPATALNPFATGRAASDDVLRGIWSDSDRIGRGRKEQVTALARGSVVQLPAGALEAVVGAETAHDRFDATVTNQPAVHDGRRDSA
ncbi:MAG: TonB-dependent receptor plug domain-containing protein, partial [Pseudomonadota bacterium]|nr:TonB-dependent receptor plug domain-containing protein [Pseudomonadota bacterium]